MPEKKNTNSPNNDAQSILGSAMSIGDAANADQQTDQAQDNDQSTDPNEEQGGEDPSIDLDPFDEDHLVNFYQSNEVQEGSEEEDEEPSDKEDDSEEAEVGDPKGNDKQRYQYWQSQADKMKNENEKLQQQMEQQQSQVQQMQAQMQQLMNGQVPQAAQPQGGPQNSQAQNQPSDINGMIQQKETEIQQIPPPEPPQKPSNYSQADAYTDPDSDSFRYQRQLEEYNQKQIQHLNEVQKKKDELYDLKMRAVEEPVKQTQKEMQMSKKEKRIFDSLQKDHNLSTEEAQDFMKTMSSPDSMKMENLVNFYRFQKGLANSSNQSSKPQKRRKPISNNANAAPPPAKGGGSKGTDTSPDDAFTLGLLQNADNM